MVNVKLPFVIGAGLARTGSDSLRKALQELGYNAFHMKAILDEGSPIEPWMDYAVSRRNKADNALELKMSLVNHVVKEGFNATTDLPACLLFKELLEIQPDAKVILSIRTDPEVWANSVLNTVAKVPGLTYNKYPFDLSPFFSSFSLLNIWVWEELGEAPLGEGDGSKPKDRDTLMRIYKEWNDHVIATVPKKQLLIHKSSDGFGPICVHLGIPSEECPKTYPHVNNSKEFQKYIYMFIMIRVGFWLAVFILAISFARFIYLMFGNQKAEKASKQD